MLAQRSSHHCCCLLHRSRGLGLCSLCRPQRFSQVIMGDLPGITVLISGVDICLLSTLFPLAPVSLWVPLYLCGCALPKSYIRHAYCPQIPLNIKSRTRLSSTDYLAASPKWIFLECLLQVLEMELSMLYVGIVIAIATGILHSPGLILDLLLSRSFKVEGLFVNTLRKS